MTGEGNSVDRSMTLGDWVEKARIAQDAWAWGKRMGYPVIRPGLEFRESAAEIH